MKYTACERSGRIEAHSVLGALRPKIPLSLALIEDDVLDCRAIQKLLSMANMIEVELDHFPDVDSFLACSDRIYDVIVLDRFINRVGICEDRIREIKGRSPECGLVMHTGATAPHLRANAVQEGAMSVVEKGSLSPAEFELLIMTAACIGSKISN